MSTQNVLMEALRIFDEKKRDGTLEAGEPRRRRRAQPLPRRPSPPTISGSATSRACKRKRPGAVTAPEERREDESHRRRVRKELDGFPAADQERLVAFLLRVGEPPPLEEGAAGGDGSALAVILFTRDQLFSHAVTTSCAVRGVFVFATDEPQDLKHIIEQSLARDLTPLLVFDPPGEGPEVFSEESTNATLQGIRGGYPALRFIRLVEPGQDDLALRALAAGALATLAKPPRSTDPVGLRRAISSAFARGVPRLPAAGGRAARTGAARRFQGASRGAGESRRNPPRSPSPCCSSSRRSSRAP